MSACVDILLSNCEWYSAGFFVIAIEELLLI